MKRNCTGRFLSARNFLVAGILAALVTVVTAGMARPVSAQNAENALFLPMVSTDLLGEQSEPTPTPSPSPSPSPSPTPPPPTPWPDPAPDTPSSEFLIESARQSGKLDDETALLYRVYANFYDERLPAEYRGNDSQASPSLALHQAQAQMAELSAEAQAILASFFAPPLAPDGWLEQQAAQGQQLFSAQNSPQASEQNRIKWRTTCQTDPNIKVWYQERYPEDVDDARALCEFVGGTVWPRLKSLFGRTPPDDSGYANNGGDGQLDLYLVNAKTMTVGYAGCFNTPSYILVNNRRWTEAQIVEAVMGAFLNGYAAECMEYLWVYAASRAWAIDYVLPSNNHEQTYADDFLNHTDLSLNTFPIVPLDHENQIGDGAYLWLWYATNMAGDAKSIMRSIWENATNDDSLAVVNAAVPGGFEQHWSKFSQQNWNNEPVATYFMLDQLLHSTKPQLEAEVKLEGKPDGSFELDGNVKHLAAHTYHFTFDDPTVRSVLFINPFHDGNWPTARVDAIYQLSDGTWVIEEWTDKYSKEFCRDLLAERVVDLTLVISNHEWQDRGHKLEPSYPPRLNFTNIACRGWKFEGTADYTRIGDEILIKDNSTTSAIFMNAKVDNSDADSHSIDTYRATEGTVSWSHNGTSYVCTGSGSGTINIEGEYQTVLFLLNHATDLETGTKYMPGERRYSGFGTEGQVNKDNIQVEYTCPGGSSHKVLVWSASRWFFTELVPTQYISDDGTTIKGTHTIVDNLGTTVDTTIYEWTMTALPPE